MVRRKKSMFKCPLCGFLSWQTRLETSSYPLELVEVKSDGRGLIKHIFFDWDAKNTLHSLFKTHFYGVLDYLLRHRYVNAKVVQELAKTYVKAPEVFHPDVVLNPGVVYKPDVVYSPNVVE